MELNSLWAIAFTSFVVGFSGAMMPGPVLSVTISEVSRRGFLAGPLIVLGHGIIELILVIGLTLGLSRILTQDPVMGVIGVVGGIFLLWLGFGMCRDVIKGRISLDLTKGGKKSDLGPILAGILTSLSNPYWSLWWATVGLAYVLIAMKLGKIGLAFFFTGHILSDLVWYSLVAMALSLGRKLFSDKMYRGLVAICGVFLIGLGIYFAYSGVGFIT